MPIPPPMGSAIGINFQPTGGGKAAITGDFVLTGDEVNPVIRALRAGGVEVTAIHNHDPASRRVVRSVPLPAHPEGFQVRDGRAYVNLPNAGGVAVVDMDRAREVARWRSPGPHFNFPLALSADGRQLAVVYRLPAKLVIFSAATGAIEQKLDACGDADDVYFDRAQTRLYVTCGGGDVDVFARTQAGFGRAQRTPTRSGARTGLYSAKLDRLFVAARARGSQPAAILVLRPQ
jgi:hypothetical protein